MPIELLCGQCHGTLLAEGADSIVACPHCGTPLQVPGEGFSSPTPHEDSDGSEESTRLSAMPIFTRPLASLPAEPSGESASHVRTDDSGEPPLSELPSHSTPRMTLGEAQPEPSDRGSILSFDSTLGTLNGATGRLMEGPGRSTMVPRTWFLILASYASAVTLAFLFLLFLLSRWKTHALENLPDVVPKVQNGETALEVAPPEANVPPGHVVALGETRRFGSLRVTPLRVTLGPLEFEHMLNDPAVTRSPSRPVLKLWIRFENVSSRQTFSPLDSRLVFKRYYQDDGSALTNQFLCRVDERRRGGKLHYLFELSSASEFQVVGQNLGVLLGPGQSLETFLPSEEQIAGLEGSLVWRVHFRKGYHPRTRHGVTTLIDVPFHRDDVQSES